MIEIGIIENGVVDAIPFRFATEKQRAAAQVSAHETGVLKYDTPHMRAAHIGFVEFGVTEVGAVQHRREEVGLHQVGAAHGAV